MVVVICLIYCLMLVESFNILYMYKLYLGMVVYMPGLGNHEFSHIAACDLFVASLSLTYRHVMHWEFGMITKYIE